MSVTIHERPGVYSSYDASSALSGGTRGKLVGIAANNAKAAAGAVEIVTSYDQAVTLFGGEDEQGMTALIRLALTNGARGVAAVPVAGDGDYQAAFAQLAELDEVGILLCDSIQPEIHGQMRECLLRFAQNRRECLGVVAGAEGESVQALLARANALNCERMVLVAPNGVDASGTNVSGLPVAAAVAGAIAGELDPAVPLGGAELFGLSGLACRYEDGEIDLLLLGGVTPVETVAGRISVVRGVTTRTKTGEVPDRTWRELTTIRVVDDVIPTIRTALRTKFRRAKNTAQSRSAIRSQVVLELENKLARESITSYDNVSVRVDPEEPTRCLVDFSFTVTHGLNQIWLTAHITV